MMKKIFTLLAMLVLLLGMAACDDDKDLFSFQVNNASLQPIGQDSVTYKAQCHVKLSVVDGQLQMLVTDLQASGSGRNLPAAIELQSARLKAEEHDVTHIRLTGDEVRSNLFVTTDVQGDIDLVKHRCTLQFTLNGTQPMRLEFATDPASLQAVLAQMLGTLNTH